MYTQLFSSIKNGQTTLNFRYPIFAGLPLLHYSAAASLRSPTYSAQATQLCHAITVLTPLPAHSGAQFIWALQSFIDIFTLDLRVNGFVRFCTLRHRYPPLQMGPLVSLATRPGFSFKEPRRVASAGLVRKIKIYHSSIDLLVLDGFGGAWWCNNSIPQWCNVVF